MPSYLAGRIPLIAALIACLIGGACAVSPNATLKSSDLPLRHTFRIVNSYPHDSQAFTQGLVFENEHFYEGTGLIGQSDLRKVDPATGKIVQQASLDPEYFGEGIAVLGDRIIQLTLASGIGLVFDKESFDLLEQFHYSGAGWGLTHDGQRLIMSDGTETLRFLDPRTYEEIGHLTVTENGNPVKNLNELEYVNGEIYANVWQTDQIARISPDTGQILGWIDLTGVLVASPQPGVLNGIAYDAQGERLFVTGKNWPVIFEIELELVSAE